ncbi:MAG: type II toxin-antitoxin system MqsR family toxin [Desulfovibrio sp.]|jgi:motility quorum-sensing regulator/GCU-specific mRNA interferase toxin|nr:type II toxin-antitoxin system MqsR family toxin [Desulfovibrio sp.]
MEKTKPHHQLDDVKRLVTAGEVIVSVTALRGADALGLTLKDVIDVVLLLDRSDFYKSMTSYSDHQSWQDVYRPLVVGVRVYLKLTIRDGVVVLSFKEL